jgi:hypothetical protein
MGRSDLPQPGEVESQHAASLQFSQMRHLEIRRAKNYNKDFLRRHLSPDRTLCSCETGRWLAGNRFGHLGDIYALLGHHLPQSS